MAASDLLVSRCSHSNKWLFVSVLLGYSLTFVDWNWFWQSDCFGGVSAAWEGNLASLGALEDIADGSRTPIQHWLTVTLERQISETLLYRCTCPRCLYAVLSSHYGSDLKLSHLQYDGEEQRATGWGHCSQSDAPVEDNIRL
jgi:hypothetical protein